MGCNEPVKADAEMHRHDHYDVQEAELTAGPQSLAQPSLMGISTTDTFGASSKAALASAADCSISKPVFA